ncbi:MAG: type II secretion system protein [Patescibacteria group bacterium]
MLNRKKGFTLLEVLVVIGIIGVLTALGTVFYRTAQDDAEIAKAQADIDTLYEAIGELMVDTAEWPGHQTPEMINTSGSNELWDLTTAEAGLLQTDGSYTDWDGPYLPSIPLDPWGNQYFLDTDYDLNGVTVPVVGSFGPNGVGPNVYDSDDIVKVIY